MLVFSAASRATPPEPPAEAPASAASSALNPDGPLARKGWRPVANLGLTYGGVDLYSVTFADGTSSTIKSGALLEVGLGGLWQAPNLPFSVQLTANYHTDSDNILRNLGYVFFDAPPSNTQLFFQRYPIEALAYYTGFGEMRIGGGVRFVRNPRAVGFNNGVTEELYFKNTVGWVAEIGIPLDRMWLNFRFVSERYDPVALKQNGVTMPASGGRVNGSHIGINLIAPLDNIGTQGGGAPNSGVTSESQSSYTYGHSKQHESERDDVVVSGKRNVQINDH